MENVLKDLQILGGVQYGCVVKDAVVLASTFPSVLNENLTTACKIFEQIFMGVENIGEDHSEVLFELEENYMIGYHIDHQFTILLLVEKDTNFSLVHMTVRSAARQIAKLLEDPKAAKAAAAAAAKAAKAAKAAEAAQAAEAAKAAEAEAEAPAETAPADKDAAADAGEPAEAVEEAAEEAQSSIEPLLDDILGLLTRNVGPAAKLIFRDAMDEWQNSFEPNKENLNELAQLLVVDIEGASEKSAFLREVGKLIR